MTETAANSAPRRIQAILMDQFGTLTDQHGSMTRLLTAEASVAAAVGCGAGSGAGVLATSLAARGHGAGATDPPFEMSRTGRDRLERVCGTVEGWIPQENVSASRYRRRAFGVVKTPERSTRTLLTRESVLKPCRSI
jgi:hypothetical protein